MAHIQTQYGGLWKPQDLTLDKISSQKMFVDNIDKIEDFTKATMQNIHAPVQNITALRAINTSDTTLFATGMLIMVYEMGVYYFNRSATGGTGADGNAVIAPITGGGAWVPITPTDIPMTPRLVNSATELSTLLTNVLYNMANNSTKFIIVKAGSSEFYPLYGGTAHMIINKVDNLYATVSMIMYDADRIAKKYTATRYDGIWGNWIQTPSAINGTVTSENADYAEVGEWKDGNTSDEDRIGYFVSVDESTAGTTMVKATSSSDVRGVTVVHPAFSGNCSAEKFDSNGNLKKQYDYVAVMGLVSVIDNGTCTINGRCMPNDSGTAVPSTNNMGYQVIDRIDNTHILIAVKPSADMIQRIKTDIVELYDCVMFHEYMMEYNDFISPVCTDDGSSFVIMDDDGNVIVSDWNFMTEPVAKEEEDLTVILVDKTTGCMYRKFGGITEWVNPPMELGVEYRTTERYLGKPVYAKLVDFGTLPNATIKTVNHGVSYVGQCFSVEGSVSGNGKNLNGLEGLTALYRNGNNLIAITNTNMSDLTAYVLMKYTKITD